MKLFQALLAAGLATTAIAVGSASAAAQSEEGSSQPGNERPAQPESGEENRLDIMPLVDISAPHPSGNYYSPVGGYIRFYLCEYSQCEVGYTWSGGRRVYADDHRSGLERFFVGRSSNRLLSVRLNVREPNVGGTATIASSAYASRRSNGQTWTTEVNGRRYLTPYLRVDPGTVVGIEVSLNASRTVEANVSRAILDIIGRAAALAQPTGDLVTSLNEDRFQRAAEFVDTSISSLFAQSVGEKAAHEFGVSDWRSGNAIGQITARFPMGHRVLDTSRQQEIGRWELRASTPLVSIFSDVPLYAGRHGTAPAGTAVDNSCSAFAAGADLQACLAFRTVSPQRVLSLVVGENVTLGQAILSDPAVIAGINGGSASAGSLCSAIAAKAESLGLNRYDSAAAVWAMQQSSQVRAAQLLTGAVCDPGSLAHSIIVARRPA